MQSSQRKEMYNASLMMHVVPLHKLFFISLSLPPQTSHHYVLLCLLLQGEVLRQILVNRYYGNFHRSGGRRDSLTSFSNGPLGQVGPGKSQSGGTQRRLLLISNNQHGSLLFILFSGVFFLHERPRKPIFQYL